MFKKGYALQVVSVVAVVCVVALALKSYKEGFQNASPNSISPALKKQFMNALDNYKNSFVALRKADDNFRNLVAKNRNVGQAYVPTIITGIDGAMNNLKPAATAMAGLYNSLQ
jgi:hypothetical protein